MVNPTKTAGILALQGCVDPHKPHLEACGVAYKEVRTAEDMTDVDGYILPGGESSTMLRLIKVFELEEKLKEEFATKPVWGICAGAILMASEVTHPAQRSFGLLDMSIRRNGYGRQLESFETTEQDYPVSYIRAPIIEKIGKDVEVITQGDTPTWVQNGSYMATTFHPELTDIYPSPMHKAFCDLLG